MNKSAVVLSRILALALVVFVATGAFAQIQNGVFTGTVSDPQGAAVVGAVVSITNQDTGVSTKATTNQNGVYTSQALPVGDYKFTVESAGFKTATKQSVKLDVGTTARLDFRMAVGQATETIEVTTEAAIVNTEDSKLSSNVSSSQIANLPLNGRNVYDLIRVAPGAINAEGVLTENGENAVVNGVRMNFNGFLLNGVSNKGLSGGANTQPIQDSVQEFQLLTLNMSAQYGNSAGAITNLVTKGGTNAFHGTGFFFYRDDVMDATPFFINHNGEEKPPLTFKQFGATLGGPIVKDKLFFYGAWQGNRFLTVSTPTPGQVESAAFRQAVIATQPGSVAALLYNDFVPSNSSGSFMTLDEYVTGANSPTGFTSYAEYMCDGLVGAATAQRFANLFGVAATDDFAAASAAWGVTCNPLAVTAASAVRGAGFLDDALNFGPDQAEGNLFDGNEYSGRIDWNATNNDRIFGQFNWLKSNDKFFSGPTALRGFINPNQITAPNTQISYTHVFSPTIVNEFKAGHSGFYQGITTGLGGVPAVGFDDGTIGFGSYNGYPQTFHENIYTYSDLVSITKGKHSIKIGGEARRNMENSEFNVARPSYYFFDPLFFAVDRPYNEAAGVNPNFSAGINQAHLLSNVRHWRNWEYGFYFQDDWKIHPRLTLNLGLRYDLYQRHNELDGLATTFLFGPGDNPVEGMRNANEFAGTGSCTTPQQIAQVVMAGTCGPGGFSPAENLGQGDHNNFGPRLGFAWDMFGTGKTSLRGGYGVSYEGTLYNPLSNSRWNPPYYSFNSVTNDVALNVYGLPDNGAIFYGPQSGGAPSYTGSQDPLNNQGPAEQAQAIGNIAGWNAAHPNTALLTGIVLPEGLRDPYVHNAFLSIQHELMPRLVMEVNYVGTFGHRLFRAQHINRSAGGRLPAGVCINTQDAFARTICSNNVVGGNNTGFINGNYGTMRQWSNSVSSNYHGLQASLKKAMAHGLAFNVNYTWSHAIDTGSTWHSGATSSNGAAGGEGYNTDYELPEADRGNAIFDVRHRLVANWTWDLPTLKDANAFVRHVFGNWSYNGIVSYQSGAHWSPYNSLPRALTALVPGACAAATFDQANCVNTGGDYNLDRVTNDRPNSTVANFNPSTDEWADGWGNAGTLFSAPCLGCIGNLGRNSFVGPSFIASDMGLIKGIPITETVKLQFRFDAFNVFNKTNFQLPGANSAGNNRIHLANFGQAGGTFNPRQLQLGLRLQF
jgi:hypothetical protein